MTIVYPLGAQRSPEDGRDYPVAAFLTGSGALPDDYDVAPMPMSLDQGFHGSCTLMASTVMKMVEDRPENGGRWPDYDWETVWAELCANYGADDRNGFYVRGVLDYLLHVGHLPRATKRARIYRVWRTVVNGALRYVRRWWDRPAAPAAFGGERQRIGAYYAVSVADPDEMKRAILELGPLVVAGAWDANWNYTLLDGTLKAPVGRVLGGHAWVIYGWRTIGGRLVWLCVNSWGELFGVKGRFRLPDEYRGSQLWEAWKAVDA